MALDQAEVAAALPGYDIGGELGRGGWGVVLGGRHRQLDRLVAIKQLPRAFAADAEVRKRFVAEARLLASLDHPHIVPVFDFVERDGLCLLVMERLDGGTVWTRFTTTGLTPFAACAIAMATCAGLDVAHRKGILHRDIKPENLMFAASGVVKLTDFGIAKVLTGSQTCATRAGDVLGTPAYMAPEQALGGELTPATDVYAVGTLLYELLAGVLPFDSSLDGVQLLHAHAYEPPRPLRDAAPQVPPQIAGVAMQAVATDPAERFATAESLGVAIATAATEAWGPGWLGRADTPVLAAGDIVAVTERATPTADRSPAPITEIGAPVTVRDGPAVTPAAMVAVRSTTAARAVGVGAEDVAAADLVPLQRIVEVPAFPARLVGVGAVLLLLVVGLAVVGVGSPSRGGSLQPGASTVGGTDPALHVVHLDLSQAVDVTGPAQVAGTAVDTVSLALSADGVRLTAKSEPVAASGGVFAATLDLSDGRYFVPHEATARLELIGGGKVLTSRRFAVLGHQPSLLTAPGVGSVLLTLVVVAWAESLLRHLRRGRRPIAGPPALGGVGVLFGIAMTLVAWGVGLHEPTILTILLTAIVGAGAGVVAALAALRISRRRRWRRT